LQLDVLSPQLHKRLANMFKLFHISLVLILLLNTYGQELSDYRASQDRLSQILGLEEESQKIPEVIGKEFLISSVNENEYIVDAGDVFLIKIDVKGPALKVFNSIVTPAGYIMIPDAPTVYVRYLSLKNAREKITSTLKLNFPQAKVEAHLFNLHQVGVDVLGALPRPGKIVLNSGNRLFDAVTYKLSPLLSDTTLIFNWSTMSLRSVEIRRDHNLLNYDLLDYRLTGNLLQNPYIMDGDIIFINFKDSLKHSVSVRGAIGQPIDFEYRPGDNIQKAISFASGFLPIADSNRIELVKSSHSELVNKVISFNYTLKDDEGTILDSSANKEPLTFLSGSQQIIPKLEEALNRMIIGSKKNVKIAAADAYGEYSESAIQKIKKDQFPKEANIEIGMTYIANSPDGKQMPFLVSEINEQDVIVDFNHPLAGKDLEFDVELLDVRDATPEEVQELFIPGDKQVEFMKMLAEEYTKAVFSLGSNIFDRATDFWNK